jgi:hypothetical protein
MLFYSIQEFRFPIATKQKQGKQRIIAAMILLVFPEDTSKRINGVIPSQAE